MKIEDLKAADYNPRAISPEAFVGLKASIRTMGDISGICFNKRTGHLFAGHQRLKALMDEYGAQNLTITGPDDDPVLVCPNGDSFHIRVVDWAEDLERLANISANNSLIQGDWTKDINDLLKQAENDFPDMGKDLRLEALGDDIDFSKKTYKKLDVKARLDESEKLQKEWGTATGQVWKLGHHRMICGDCTDRTALTKIMGSDRANLLFTSPPYWVGMEYETQKSEAEIDDFISKCAMAWTNFVKKSFGRIVINTGTASIHRIETKRKVEVLPLLDKWQRELKKAGWLLRHTRIWAKAGGLPASIAPKTDTIDQHWEHIITFENEEWEYLGTFWNPNGDQRGQERLKDKSWAQQGVWSTIPGESSGGGEAGRHCAAFPIEIPERHIAIYTQKDEVVFEPFLGSGTTIIASEKLGRKCVAMEISPLYTAVALQRYKDATGVTPVKEA